MVVIRRNIALLAQAGVGAITALFVASTAVAPFAKASALLAIALTTAASLGAVALVFECVMLPFGASGIGARVRPFAIPWAILGSLGTASILLGEFDIGLPGQSTIWILRAATVLTLLLSAGLWARDSTKRTGSS